MKVKLVRGGKTLKRQKYHLEAPLSFLWCSNALPLLVEIFLARSHVASDFCGSFGVKQHSLFPPFNLPA